MLVFEVYMLGFDWIRVLFEGVRLLLRFVITVGFRGGDTTFGVTTLAVFHVFFVD